MNAEMTAVAKETKTTATTTRNRHLHETTGRAETLETEEGKLSESSVTAAM